MYFLDLRVVRLANPKVSLFQTNFKAELKYGTFSGANLDKQGTLMNYAVNIYDVLGSLGTLAQAHSSLL